MGLRQKAVVGLGDWVNGRWLRTSHGMTLCSRSPADLGDVMGYYDTDVSHASVAIEAAKMALVRWRRAPLSERIECLHRYRDALVARRDELVIAIARSVGKPLWEAKTEVDAMVAKVNITLGPGIESLRAREVEPGAWVRFRPVGVCVVLGPFNFPGHLANGHIVPALALGNTVIFKPSERAPMVGEIMAECFEAAGFPQGVVNVVQGDGTVAQALVESPEIDAVMFTGSTVVGQRIIRTSASHVGRMLALEMGGNNPAIICDDADISHAVREVGFSAFVTAGQRCTAVRRVLVHRRVAQEFTERLAACATLSKVGSPSERESFLGPVISAQAKQETLDWVLSLGAKLHPIVSLESANVPGFEGHYLRPGVYEVDHQTMQTLGAHEWFAPLVFVQPVDDDEAMISQANCTQFGLASAVFSSSQERFRRIADELECGLVNWNRGTVGSSSRLPFGGVKSSGNHRAAGLSSALYCVDPVAELHLPLPVAGMTMPGFYAPE
ncbi:MAG: aldehyde dehydrogenase family protein [Deltaproteobacteria bacterium]|nr:aldehyde dehydrogenase family protein [Deltaproteobacteria bacterium]